MVNEWSADVGATRGLDTTLQLTGEAERYINRGGLHHSLGTLPSPPFVLVERTERGYPRPGRVPPSSQLLPELFSELEPLGGGERKAFAERAYSRFVECATLLARDVIPEGFGDHKAARTSLPLCLSNEGRP